MNFGQIQCYSWNTFGLKDTPNLRIHLFVVRNSDYCNLVTLNGRKHVHTTDPHLAELLWSNIRVHTAKWNESMTCCTHDKIITSEHFQVHIDIVALTPYGYNLPCTMVTLHVLTASPKLQFKTLCCCYQHHF